MAIISGWQHSYQSHSVKLDHNTPFEQMPNCCIHTFRCVIAYLTIKDVAGLALQEYYVSFDESRTTLLLQYTGGTSHWQAHEQWHAPSTAPGLDTLACAAELAGEMPHPACYKTNACLPELTT